MIKEEIKSNQVITFGCRLNSYESELIKKAIKKSDQQNLVVFNSCAVTAQAERELRQKIRSIRKKNPQAKIVVTGCAAQIDPEKYAKMPEVDLVLGNVEKSQSKSYEENFLSPSNPKNLLLVEKDLNFEIAHKDRLFLEEKSKAANFLTKDETGKIKVNSIMSVRDTAPQLISYFENKTRAFLEIQNGCNHRCTFCIIPFGRGNSRSVAFGEIVEQVKKTVSSGHQEIVFTGVDISDYGRDLSAPITLSQMIKRLFKLVPELPRLRLSSIDVAEIDDGILDLLANEPRFMPYFHLSVQSGDDIILKRMARRHNRKQILEFCAKVRKLRPQTTFGADIIAGFPTENEEMFLNSKKLIEEVGIIFTHIFPYSKRIGTPAANMPQLDGKIIKKRAKILREAGQEQLQKFLKTQIGNILQVIVEKDGMAKSENFLDVKIIGSKNLKSGEIFKVKVLSLEENFLIAQKV
jgi:threonylcarbamoyladenosine tRNA methylthiotransferase MtaB